MSPSWSVPNIIMCKSFSGLVIKFVISVSSVGILFVVFGVPESSICVVDASGCGMLFVPES